MQTGNKSDLRGPQLELQVHVASSYVLEFTDSRTKSV